MGIRLSVVLSILLIGFSGCVKKDSRAGDTQPAAAGNVSDVMNVVKRSEKVPNFSWKDSTGKIQDFDSYRGRVTFVNFWATWCGPCKKELPDLVALSQELAPRNVRFIGVSTDRGPNIIEDVRTFVGEHGITYPVVVSNDDLDDAFGDPRMIPTSFIVDSDGKIAKTLVGLYSKEALSQAITALLK